MVLKATFFVGVQEYIHRVGRTARGEGGVGHALLILQPEELGFLLYLRKSKVALNEFEFSWSKIANIQSQVSKIDNAVVNNFVISDLCFSPTIYICL